MKVRFAQDFIVHGQLILVDALQPNCLGIKALKNCLSMCRSEILQVFLQDYFCRIIFAGGLILQDYFCRTVFAGD